MDCKGMVQCSGKTYRIMKIGSGSYEVVRILDDTRMGTFDVSPRLQVHPDGVPEKLLLEIALTALKEAKLSWSSQVRPRPALAVVPPARRDSSGLVGP
jgi:hypothetical protein